MPSITTPGHRPSRASISRAISEATPKAILAQLKAMALYISAFITSPGRASHGGFIFWGMKKESGSFQEIWNLLVSKCLLYSTYSIYIYTYLFICVYIYRICVPYIYIYTYIFSAPSSTQFWVRHRQAPGRHWPWASRGPATWPRKRCPRPRSRPRPWLLWRCARSLSLSACAWLNYNSL